MKGWGLAWRIVDTLLGLAIRADELAERRRARNRELLATKDDKSSRSRAKTVVLPRPPEPTSPPTAGAARAPTASSRATPRRR